MPYDEGLAQRIRDVLAAEDCVEEKKMFGGIAYMVHGNMCCGVVQDELMARVGADRYEDSLAQPHARPMDFTGKPLKGFVYVAAPGIDRDEDLQAWVQRALAFVRSLPAKD